MKSTNLPFNIEIMQVDGGLVRNLKPVSSTDIMESSGQKLGPAGALDMKNLKWQGGENLTSNFHSDGLFSIETFGRLGDKRRDTQFSYVNIKTTIFHPLIYKALGKLKGLYLDIMAGKAYAVWDPKEKDFIASDDQVGETGYQFFVQHWAEIKFKRTESPTRDERINLINKYKDRALTSRILIMPAGLRDVRVGAGNRLEFDEINDIYRRIVGISRTVAGSGDKITSPALNYSRYQLQTAFNEVYTLIERMLRDKKGFVQNKWARRRVFNGTRNVISSMDTSKEYLGGVGAPKAYNTILGLYQTMRGAMPFTVNHLRSGYLSEAFGEGDSSTMARLVNPKTYKRENVELPSLTKDKWTTLDGLEKVVNSFKELEVRHQPVMVEDYYLALIYKGPDKTFRIFGDIQEFPEHLDRKYVEPITLVEFLYLSGYQRWNDLKVITTRYPVTGMGSSYPSDLYVKTSVVGEVRYELGPDWEKIGDEYVAEEFPTKEPNAFLDSATISPSRVPGLGADFDGDTVSNLIVYSDEAMKEIEKNLHSREAYSDPSGGLRTSTQTDTIALLMRNLTGDYPTVDE